ncbi:MAG: cytochrome c [Chloroflexi bacterium]|nr:cytochrome c [Chloroflexota bacterium]
MKLISLGFTRIFQYITIAMLAVVMYLAVTLWSNAHPVHALPEYAARTGEACATCHVSPGGGGPRTLRGLLWAARGQPDQVPTLPGVLVAPGVADGAELYDIACAACHGQKGEGIFGVELRSTALKEGKIRSAILRGKTRSGMPAFEGQLTDEQLEALVTFVTGLADGEIQPPPDTYLLPPAQLMRVPHQTFPTRGGN